MMEFYEDVKKTYFESLIGVSQVQESLYLIVLSVFSFFLPFVLGHPQWVIGIIVNAALIFGATYLRGYKLLPLILLPSLGVLSVGLIFGSFTWYLVYIIPFIWAGNAIYVYGYKYLAFKKQIKLVAILIASVVKTSVIFAGTYLLYSLGVVPAIFLTLMGILQLVTAVAGGILAMSLILIHQKTKT